MTRKMDTGDYAATVAFLHDLARENYRAVMTNDLDLFATVRAESREVVHALDTCTLPF
jgi:hypothetical protein